MNRRVSVFPYTRRRDIETKKHISQSHWGSEAGTQGLQGAINSLTHMKTGFFLVCVNLIIQIFIYTVRKNLLIFISSQAP